MSILRLPGASSFPAWTVRYVWMGIALCLVLKRSTVPGAVTPWVSVLASATVRDYFRMELSPQSRQESSVRVSPACACACATGFVDIYRP
jgi:hypothetical protein